MFDYLDAEVYTKSCESISGITEEQYRQGTATIEITDVDEFLVNEEADVWAYLIGFINTQTGKDGVLSVTAETLHALNAACHGLVGRKLQVDFYADDEGEYCEDGGNYYSEALSWGIHINSVAEVVTVYTAD